MSVSTGSYKYNYSHTTHITYKPKKGEPITIAKR